MKHRHDRGRARFRDVIDHHVGQLQQLARHQGEGQQRHAHAEWREHFARDVAIENGDSWDEDFRHRRFKFMHSRRKHQDGRMEEESPQRRQDTKGEKSPLECWTLGSITT